MLSQRNGDGAARRMARQIAILALATTLDFSKEAFAVEKNATGSAPTSPDAVVEPQQVAGLLAGAGDAAAAVWLDARAKDKYAAGHMRDARWVDVKEWDRLSHSPDSSLEHVQAWRDRAAALGVGPATRVIVYDDGDLTSAARVWFTLRAIGADHVAVLNGGFPALRASLTGSAVETGAPATSPAGVSWPKDDAARPQNFAAKADVHDAIQQRSARILDVRSPDEYSGADPRRNPRGGHLPGAVLLPHTRLFDDAGRLHSAEELAALFRAAGLKPDQAIIVHCQSGGRASVALLAAERAGYRNVRNYNGSFGEWSQDLSSPVEAGGGR